MAEWFKATVLKTVVGCKPTVGSNPTFSARQPALSSRKTNQLPVRESRESGKMEKTRDPFLLRFATDRKCDGLEMVGRYSEERQLWVVDTDEGPQPIIEVAPDVIAATQTKTMTRVEADDDDQNRGAMMETSTYTEVKQESDDRNASLGLPEIQTKTDVQQETDDQIDGAPGQRGGAEHRARQRARQARSKPMLL